MEQISSTARKDPYGKKINRDHSPVLVYGIPWLTILLGSLTPLLPIISPAPIFPPLALLIMIAWRVLRPGLLPLWAGFPLGLFDDLFSGQPIGSAILLFSCTLMAIEFIEMRFPWRGFWQDWLLASIISTLYLIVAALFSGSNLSILYTGVILPQIALTIALFPLIVRIISLLDRLRLMRIRRLR